LLLPERRFSLPGQLRLPNAERAFVDIAKLRDYSLSPQYKEGAAQGLGLRVGTGSRRIRCRAKPRLPLTGFRSNLEALKAMAYCVYREEEFFVAQCLNVDVSSFGATREAAVTNLKEAVELYFQGEPADAYTLWLLGAPLRFKFRQGKHVAAQEEEAGNLLAQPAVEGRVGLGQGNGDVPPGETHQRGQFRPALLLESEVHQGRVLEQGAHRQFFFAGIHGQASKTLR